MSAIEVRAAGGVVLREQDGTVQMLLVHRPKYDDWSFPKGKLDPGESSEEAAVREVLEETALACRRLEELPPASYRDASGRLKEVRYWLMAPESGDAEARVPDAEVDHVRWLTASEANSLLTYPRDRQLAQRALETHAARTT